MSARRAEKQQTYVPKPLDLSEYKTRKIYIDSMLVDAGWTEGKDWINEVELPGMPNKSEVGFADYVLYDDAHKPLAVIEAKRTCVDVAKGRQQAKLYADILEKEYGRRPVIFLTNGFDTRIIDNQYPERKVAEIYSKRDLEKWYNLQSMKTSLNHISVDKNIAGRYYQEAAIKAVCDSFDKKNRRKALLVMATGSGKTRTVMLGNAIDTLNDNEHPLVHSDRGCHYRWPDWIKLMVGAALTRSMSKKGCSPDNSACEGLFGRIKNEMFYSRDWGDTSVQQFIEILDEYLIWYNDKRIKESLGYMSPREYRQSLGLVA